MGIAPQFVVPDVVKTAEYYRDLLGFSIIEYALDPPVFAMVERDGIQIHFGKADGDEIKTNESLRKIAFDAYIWVEDFDYFFEELRERNATIVEGPVKRTYSSREFVIRDCNGFRIAFGD